MQGSDSTNDTIELLNSVKVGDVIAFEKLADVKNGYGKLLEKEVSSFFASYRLAKSDLEDLRQEALFALYNAACSYKDNDNVTFGLYAEICIDHRLIDVARKLAKAYSEVVESTDDDEEPCTELLEDTEASPEMHLIASERMREIQHFIETELTDYEKRVFSRHLAHRDCADIAAEVGKDVKSVYNAVERVKKKFRDRYF